MVLFDINAHGRLSLLGEPITVELLLMVIHGYYLGMLVHVDMAEILGIFDPDLRIWVKFLHIINNKSPIQIDGNLSNPGSNMSPGDSLLHCHQKSYNGDRLHTCVAVFSPVD